MQRTVNNPGRTVNIISQDWGILDNEEQWHNIYIFSNNNILSRKYLLIFFLELNTIDGVHTP